MEIGLYIRAQRMYGKVMDKRMQKITKQDCEQEKQKLYVLLSNLHSERSCGACGAKWSSSKQLLPCSGCLKEWYCNRQCQKKGWKKSHGTECSKEYIEFKERLKEAKRSPFP